MFRKEYKAILYISMFILGQWDRIVFAVHRNLILRPLVSCTPLRTPRISGLKYQILKPPVLS